MQHRKRGHVSIQSQPTRQTRNLQRLALVPFLIVSLGFVVLGVTVLIPGAGLFGVIWTLVSAIFVVVAIVQMARRNGPVHRVAYDVTQEDAAVMRGMFSDTAAPQADAANDAPAAPHADADAVAARLTQLQTLYDGGLITRREYEEKRAEILRTL